MDAHDDVARDRLGESGDRDLDEAAIGAFIRARRVERGWSLKELAERCDFSVSYLSQIERGSANPTLGSVKRVGQALGFMVGDLLASSYRDSAPPPPQPPEPRIIPSRRAPLEAPSAAVVRASQRKRIVYPGSGVSNELLSPDLQRQMEVVWLDAPVGSGSGTHPLTHVGEECGVVLRGRMLFEVDGTEYVLEERDSIYFESSLPHRWTSLGPDPLHGIWIITPPAF